jgi:hypothetical protein
MVSLGHYFQIKEGLRLIIFIPRAKEEGQIMGVVFFLVLLMMGFHFIDHKAKNMKLCNVQAFIKTQAICRYVPKALQ